MPSLPRVYPMMRPCTALNSISILLVIISLAGLALSEFCDQHSSINVRTCLLASSAATAIFAVMSSTMLLFQFESYENPSRKESTMVWTIILVYLSFIELLAAGFVWYAAKYRATWYLVLVGLQIVVLLVSMIILAIWIRNSKGAQGSIEEPRKKAQKSK